MQQEVTCDVATSDPRVEILKTVEQAFPVVQKRKTGSMENTPKAVEDAWEAKEGGREMHVERL